MSEFTNHQSERVSMLFQLYDAIHSKKNAFQTIKSNENKIALITPSDIVVFVHQLVNKIEIELSKSNSESTIRMAEIKLGLNKLLNVTYKTIQNYPYNKPGKDKFLHICIQNNSEMVKIVESIRPILIQLNKDLTNKELRFEFKNKCSDLEQFFSYYILKENILFPLIEDSIPDYKCISVMWSFHDDIRSNLKKLISILDSEKELELKTINRLSGDLFFNLYAVKFREERILFPFIEENIPEEKINALWNESIKLGFPYYNPEPIPALTSTTDKGIPPELHDLKTGSLSIEQIVLIFNHLPVDITYVDENGKVRFFSNPPHRIFPRTTAIIGRDLKNCHPHESVHIVQKIVESFEEGTRDHADFWINMRNKRILIQYFAVRDSDGKYRGVLEASQEISTIQALEGEKRILDWE